jgi:6-methylsalicylic acid synthase
VVSNDTEARGVEPVAIVGMGCRLPGDINSVDQFWQFLLDGGEAFGQVPEDRWAAYRARYPSAVRGVTSGGGFLTDAGGFDAEFFGVTPREAELMDPQQRLLLEVTWQALEHAGIAPSSLAGTDVGVFVGVGSDDYGRLMLEDLPGVEAWTGVGASMCGAANRISYVLDLRGPSIALDTACSASLAALHLACASVRAGESTMAIVGGVNLVAAPGLTKVLDSAGATSPDGRSKSFDASADGYGRGEGCGVLVVKRLADAERDGDRVFAVIRGSAVSQDGRTSGIMAPNGEAQEYVARQALRQAGVDPRSVDYVEAHGTGTRAGDPIEVGALSRVYGRDDPAGRCKIGSVKANIGHLEAGAGVAGVIKAVLALYHEELAPNVNFTTPNPAIPWDTCGLEVVTRREPWPDHGLPRRAGVSSFGYGGTVAHVVLEQAPATAASEQPSPTAPAVPVYAVSGASPKAVVEYANRLADWLDSDGDRSNLADVAHTLLTRRSHLRYRAAVLAADRAELQATLRALDPDEIVRTLPDSPADPVWVFSGHGSQWLGMGRELLATEPVFAEVIDSIGPVFAEEIGFTPREALLADDLGGVDRIQPLIFAVQVALAELWRSYGVRPAAVIGHSVGEIAAAVAAGALTLHDAARLICRRSILLRRAAGMGAMAMAPLPFESVRALLGDRDDIVAAIESAPESTVVSGTPEAVREWSERWQADGLTVRTVASDVAFHSPQMDPLLDDLVAAVKDLPVRQPVIPMYSTALEDPRSDAARDGEYWATNLRNPVRLATAVKAAAEDGHRFFLELSAHPVVTHSVSDTLDHHGVKDTLVTGTLRRQQPEQTSFLTNLASLHCHGVTVNWSSRATGDLTSLPPIAWQHRQYWYTPSGGGSATAQTHDVESHTLLGAQVPVAGLPGLRVWQTFVDRETRPYPGSHPIHGVEIVPAAVLFTTFLNATGTTALTDVSLRVPVAIATPRQVQVVCHDDTVRLASRPADSEDADSHGWVMHTSAAALPGVPDGGGRFNLESVMTRYRQRRDPGLVLERLHQVGVADTGFHWTVERLAGGDDGVLATVTSDTSTWAALFDAVLTVAPLVFDGEPALRMPSYVRRLAIYGAPPARALIEVQRRAGDIVDVVVADRGGKIMCRMTGVRFTQVGDDTTAPASPQRLVHRVSWVPVDLGDVKRPNADGRRFVLVDGGTRLGQRLADELTAAGVSVVALGDHDELGAHSSATDVVVLPADATGDDAVEETWRLARSAQTLINAGSQARIWAVTTGLREAAGVEDLRQAPLWGLGRIIAGEHADVWGGLVDLPAEPGTGDLRTLLALFLAGPQEDLMSIRSHRVEATRVELFTSAPGRAALACRPDASYLITGGLGVLGLEVADWLVSRGARHLVLAGRTGLPSRDTWDSVTDPAVRRRVDSVRALEALGATVRVVSVDIADPAAAEPALDADALGLPPIRGVVHAAGVLDNRMFLDLEEQSLRTVMRPKVAGAMTLHRLFPPGSLDFLAMFSSNGQLLGLTGQANYAASNAFLDALARHRPDDTVSLAWTSWRGMGMAVSDVVDQELRDRGIGDISPPEAFAAWELASQYDEPNLVIMRTVPLEPGSRVRPILRLLDFGRTGDGSAEVGPQLAGLDAEQLRQRVVDEVARQVCAEMKLAEDDLDVRRPLSELGLDSVMTVAIRRRLEKRLQVDVPATLLWTHPTVAAVADYLVERVAPEQSDGPESAGSVEPDAVLVGG